MGNVNWTAVGAAWLAAALLGVVFYGRRAVPRTPLWQHALAAALLLVCAVMIGHMFDRVGAATLAAKPWLYAMMSGGLALTFVGPALIITAVRREQKIALALFDACTFLAAFLAMGAMFALFA